MKEVAKVKNPDKLGFGRLMAWKSSDIAAAWVNVICLQYLSMFCTDTLGIDIIVVGTLLLASKFVDGVTDILAGLLVDNTHTKLGKGRPYELGIIGQTVCTILLFACSPAWGNTVKCIWIFSMYTLTFSIFATFRNAAVNPYLIRFLSNKPVLLKKMASYGGIVTMAGSMVMSTLFPVLMARIATSAAGWTALVAIIMIPATLIGALRFLLCKEDPAVDAESKQESIRIKEILTLFMKNKYVWLYAVVMLCYNIITNLAVGSYFFKWVVGDVSLSGLLYVVAIFLLPLMLMFPWIMKKVGSMGKMITYFCGIGIVGYLICFVSGSFLPGLLFGYVLGQFATLPLAYYGVLFIMNICTYNEMIGLPRMDGSSGIIANFSTKAGAALGTYVTSVMLMLGGYISAESAVEQPASALLMMRIDFSIVPAVLLVVIAMCCLAFSRLEPKAAEFEAQKKSDEAAGAQ